jgi:uncharacterized protein YcnI
MKKIVLGAFVALALLTPLTASAHVVVKPDVVGVAKYQTFTVSVPNEKEIPTVVIKLVLPDSLESATPTVKPGWKIEVNGKEVTWTGGSIPAGQRDDFSFSTKVPAEPTELAWKAYQTYEDGTVVSWDQNPAEVNSNKEGTPYSITKVVNDLTPAPASPAPDRTSRSISYVALALSVLALVTAVRAKAQK